MSDDVQTRAVGTGSARHPRRVRRLEQHRAQSRAFGDSADGPTSFVPERSLEEIRAVDEELNRTDLEIVKSDLPDPVNAGDAAHLHADRDEPRAAARQGHPRRGYAARRGELRLRSTGNCVEAPPGIAHLSDGDAAAGTIALVRRHRGRRCRGGGGPPRAGHGREQRRGREQGPLWGRRQPGRDRQRPGSVERHATPSRRSSTARRCPIRTDPTSKSARARSPPWRSMARRRSTRTATRSRSNGNRIARARRSTTPPAPPRR